MTSPEVRNRAADEIERFKLAMLNEAASNAHKGHWSDNDATPQEHVKELLYHAQKLLIAIEVGHEAAILEYAADVANHAMFAADLAGALDAERTPEPAEGEGYEGGVPWSKQLPEVKGETYLDFMDRFLPRAKEAAGKS